MAYFILGLVVGLASGAWIAQRIARMRADRQVLAPDARVTSTLRQVGPNPDEPTPITRKAAKLGITPEDFKPSDDILERMQRAWDLGITLEELDAREASERAGELPRTRSTEQVPPPPAALWALADRPTPSTVTEAVAQLAEEGYGDDLHLDDGALNCASCGTTHPTDLVEVDRVFRFEGPSDPADEAIVLGLRCPACGAQGSLVSAFGPDADPELAQAFVYLASRAGHG